MLDKQQKIYKAILCLLKASLFLFCVFLFVNYY